MAADRKRIVDPFRAAMAAGAGLKAAGQGVQDVAAELRPDERPRRRAVPVDTGGTYTPKESGMALGGLLLAGGLLYALTRK